MPDIFSPHGTALDDSIITSLFPDEIVTKALVRDVLPLLEGVLDEQLDAHAAQRLQAMCTSYSAYIDRERGRLAIVGEPEEPS